MNTFDITNKVALDTANKALLLLECEPIDSFEDKTLEARLLSQWLVTVWDNLLTTTLVNDATIELDTKDTLFNFGEYKIDGCESLFILKNLGKGRYIYRLPIAWANSALIEALAFALAETLAPTLNNKMMSYLSTKARESRQKAYMASTNGGAITLDMYTNLYKEIQGAFDVRK